MPFLPREEHWFLENVRWLTGVFRWVSFFLGAEFLLHVSAPLGGLTRIGSQRDDKPVVVESETRKNSQNKKTSSKV